MVRRFRRIRAFTFILVALALALADTWWALRLLVRRLGCLLSLRLDPSARIALRRSHCVEVKVGSIVHFRFVVLLHVCVMFECIVL